MRLSALLGLEKPLAGEVAHDGHDRGVGDLAGGFQGFVDLADRHLGLAAFPDGLHDVGFEIPEQLAQAGTARMKGASFGFEMRHGGSLGKFWTWEWST
ncbi:hypothetical protein D3C86_1765780 [compost metagenome]